MRCYLVKDYEKVANHKNWEILNFIMNGKLPKRDTVTILAERDFHELQEGDTVLSQYDHEKFIELRILNLKLD